MTQKERRKLSEELGRHRGYWVAVRGNSVVAAAKTLAELERNERVDATDRRLVVPARHQTPYFRR